VNGFIYIKIHCCPVKLRNSKKSTFTLLNGVHYLKFEKQAPPCNLATLYRRVGSALLKAKSAQKPFSIPRCPLPQDHHTSKKSDRCFWGIPKYESQPGMIPKSNARKCYLKETASFF